MHFSSTVIHFCLHRTALSLATTVGYPIKKRPQSHLTPSQADLRATSTKTPVRSALI